ncbi:MAG: MFS transporter, partial [Candidatus Accumulibacter sp.]|nr:MFS transporter [Accumulibacter sp.]
RRGFSPRATLASLCWLWQHKPARCVILAYAFHAWELLCMWAWLPAFLSAAVALQQGTAGVLPVAGAALAALTHLVSMAGSLAGGSWSDRWGRSRVILLMALSSVACSLVFGWLLAAPLWLLVLVAVFYNFAAVGDSAIYSAALTEVVPGQHLAAAYSLRSVLGFGMGALSPWLFGIVLDAAGGTAVDAAQVSGPAPLAWGLAWSALGAVALVGPWLTWSLMRRRAH